MSSSIGNHTHTSVATKTFCTASATVRFLKPLIWTFWIIFFSRKALSKYLGGNQLNPGIMLKCGQSRLALSKPQQCPRARFPLAILISVFIVCVYVWHDTLHRWGQKTICGVPLLHFCTACGTELRWPLLHSKRLTEQSHWPDNYTLHREYMCGDQRTTFQSSFSPSMVRSAD